MINDLTGLLLSIKITDVIDIVIVAYILYRLLGMIKETRAQQLFRGVLLIVAVFLASEFFGLSLLNWLLTRLITVGLIGVIILVGRTLDDGQLNGFAILGGIPGMDAQGCGSQFLFHFYFCLSVEQFYRL